MKQSAFLLPLMATSATAFNLPSAIISSQPSRLESHPPEIETVHDRRDALGKISASIASVTFANVVLPAQALVSVLISLPFNTCIA